MWQVGKTATGWWGGIGRPVFVGEEHQQRRKGSYARCRTKANFSLLLKTKKAEENQFFGF
jgi:hypothetical protein